MKKIILMALVVMAGASFSPACADGKKKKKKAETAAKAEKPQAEPVQLLTDIDSVSYAVGMVNGETLLQYMESQGMDTTYIDDVKRGFIDAARVDANSPEAAYYIGAHLFLDFSKRIDMGIFAGDSMCHVSKPHLLAGIFDGIDHNERLMKSSDVRGNIDEMASKVRAKALKRKYAKNVEEGEKFLADNATKEGVVTLPSGLQYRVLKEGNGPVATASDQVTVNYEGKLLDGTVFDSSYARGETAKFRPTQVIKGWTEALTLMPEGSTWELYIPQNLAYGDREAGKIPPFSTLIFKVEVVKVGEDKK